MGHIRLKKAGKCFFVMVFMMILGTIQSSAEVLEFDDWTSNNQGVDGSTSDKTYNISAPAGATLSFDWSVSSESGYDKLFVYLDDELLFEASGERNGTFVRNIVQGDHILLVQYTKDGSGNQGYDRAMLSNIKVTSPDVAVIDGVSYTTTSNNSVVLLSVADTTEIVIPNEVTIKGATYSVSEIEPTAFRVCPSLTKVTIPSSVTEIKRGTFENCQNLATVILPNTLTTIGESAFKGCVNLVNIEIPSSVTNIGSYAFKDCNNIKTITLSKSISWIGSRAFEGCGGELYVNCQIPSTWNEGSPYYNCKFTKVTIGEGVETVGSYAFYSSISDAVASFSTLTEVVLPSTLTSIGEYAFYGTNLSTIELPACIDSIGYNAFPYTMSKLTCNSTTPPTLHSGYAGEMFSLGNISIVYVPQGCYSAYKDVYPWSSKVILDGPGVKVKVTVTPGMMGEEILKQANYLADVNYLTLSGAINEIDIANIKNSMPNLLTIDMSGLDMKSIPSELFYNRRALLSIILPLNVETIGGAAFYNCINLENMVLPEGLKSIGSANFINYGNYAGTFAECYSLKTVSFPTTLTTIGSYAFNGCSSLTNLVFKDQLSSIQEKAFSGCYRLEKIEFGKSSASIGTAAFENCSNLKVVEFNEGVNSIGIAAFRNCNSLKEVTFPKSLKNIDGGAFAYCGLESITFAEGLESIGYRFDESSEGYYEYDEKRGAFEHCSNLKQVSLPQGLVNLNQNTFYGCGALTSITIPEGVKFIGKNAFASCGNLESVSLPSTLTECSTAPFANCSKLSEVKCLALLPPMLADGLLTLNDMGLALKRTLKVPEWTLNRYKLTSGWAAFAEILPIKGVYPSSITIVGDAVLTLPTTGLPANYKPSMEFPYSYEPMSAWGYESSSLHLRGAGSLALSKFHLDGIYFSSYYESTKQLLNEEATITSDSVLLTMNLSNSSNNDYYYQSTMWHFLSFPFDVKLSDVVTNCEWVVRQYDGKARANNKLSSTWVTMPYDATLKAGQGYIWACTGGDFTLSAVDNANKNLIFANTKRSTPLQEYAAELVSNSGWNLVGNPYPCYYNTNEMDYTAPITVWDSYNNTYLAYSPVDDNYVLRPFEAFFVQCPANVDSLVFSPKGRQLKSAPATMAPSRSRESNLSRQVINLTLSNEQYSDRTRIVINDVAKMDYELSCDAAKFMSDDANMPQLYSESNNEKYAINERPMGNGLVKLGTHFGVAGIYTISAQSAGSMAIVLIDHKTGVETDLTINDYTFSAETCDSERFEVRLYADATNIESAASATNIIATGNSIRVTSSVDAHVEIYNVSGSLMAVGQGKTFTFEAAQGVYVVKVNGVSHKVTVVK